MLPEPPVSTIVHAIQLAVAPVFLLTGISAVLSVLTTRLGRIIDRSRILHARAATSVENITVIQLELASLKRRGRLIHWAIGLCTTSLLLICLVVAVLFLGSFVAVNLEGLVAALFIAAMLSLCLALLNFICEIYLATAHVRSGS